MTFKEIIVSLFASALLVAAGPGYNNTLYVSCSSLRIKF